MFSLAFTVVFSPLSRCRLSLAVAGWPGWSTGYRLPATGYRLPATGYRLAWLAWLAWLAAGTLALWLAGWLAMLPKVPPEGTPRRAGD